MRVFQDGADFYNWSRPRGIIWTAPFPVRDLDVAAATRARELFMVHAAKLGIPVTFDHDHDHEED